MYALFHMQSTFRLKLIETAQSFEKLFCKTAATTACHAPTPRTLPPLACLVFNWYFINTQKKKKIKPLLSSQVEAGVAP